MVFLLRTDHVALRCAMLAILTLNPASLLPILHIVIKGYVRRKHVSTSLPGTHTEGIIASEVKKKLWDNVSELYGRFSLSLESPLKEHKQNCAEVSILIVFSLTSRINCLEHC